MWPFLYPTLAVQLGRYQSVIIATLFAANISHASYGCPEKRRPATVKGASVDVFWRLVLRSTDQVWYGRTFSWRRWLVGILGKNNPFLYAASDTILCNAPLPLRSQWNLQPYLVELFKSAFATLFVVPAVLCRFHLDVGGPGWLVVG